MSACRLLSTLLILIYSSVNRSSWLRAVRCVLIIHRDRSRRWYQILFVWTENSSDLFFRSVFALSEHFLSWLIYHAVLIYFCLLLLIKWRWVFSVLSSDNIFRLYVTVWENVAWLSHFSSSSSCVPLAELQSNGSIFHVFSLLSWFPKRFYASRSSVSSIRWFVSLHLKHVSRAI